MTAVTNNIAARLGSLGTTPPGFADPSDRESYAIDGLVPAAVAKPVSGEEAAEVVRFAAREKLAVVPVGARTKLSIGATPIRYDIALDMSAVNQISQYDPEDLTVSVCAGLSLAKLNAALLDHNQFLPLLVPYYSQATIGGAIASGIDSPLRQTYGTARDFLLGAEFIDGTGAFVKSGGRVVKNVTGYDLHKLLIGSLGTLAVITRLNFRTFPAPIAGSRGFVASFPGAEGALALRRAITGSSLTPLTLDMVSPELAQIFATRTPATPETAVFAGENRAADQTSLQPIGDWFNPREWQLCASFAGTPEVLERYARELTLLAEKSRATSTAILGDATRPAVWGRLRESLSMFLEASPTTLIFKISVLPSHHAALFTNLQQIAARAALPHALVARAGGAIYFALLPASVNEDTTALLTQSIARIFDFAFASSGHASLRFAAPSRH